MHSFNSLVAMSGESMQKPPCINNDLNKECFCIWVFAPKTLESQSYSIPRVAYTDPPKWDPWRA